MSKLPPGWEYRRVDQVGDVQLGRQRSPAMMTGPYMRPYLRVANVLDGYIDYSDVLEMNFAPYEAETFGLLPGDILLNEGQELNLVGRCAIFNGPPGMCFQNTLLRFRSRTVLPKFAAVVFKSWLDRGEFRKLTRQTTSIAHLGAGQFSGMLFPRAPLQEQHQMTEILDSVDYEIRSIEELITKLSAARLATINDLLGGQSDRFPRHERLGEIVAYTMLGTASRGVDSSGPVITLLKMGSLLNGSITLDQTESVSARRVLNLSDILLQDNDLLFNTRNTPALVGKVGVWHREINRFVPDNNLLIMRFRRGISSDYICLQMTYGRPSRDVRSMATGTTSVAAIYWRDLQKLDILIPDSAVQLDITGKIQSFDRKLADLRHSLLKLRLLKKGMIDDLLTGRVRVPVG